MVNFEFPPIGSGGGKGCLEILKEFTENSNDIAVDLITSGLNKGTEIETLSDNINIYRIGVAKNSLQRWTKLEIIIWLYKATLLYKKLQNQNSYTCAHAFFGFPSGLPCYVFRKKLPYIISLRGSDVPGINPRFKLDYKLIGPLFRKIWQNADCIIACSNGLRDRARKFQPSLNIGVIENAVNRNIFFPDNNEHPGPLRMITVGRLSESKRVDLLIKTMLKLREKGIDVSLDIIGDGSEKAFLEKLTKTLGLEHNINYLGLLPSNKLPAQYRSHNLYISASCSEGMSNAMLEAMACGLPIVTTLCEGVEEIVTDNGIVVKDDPEAFANAIERLSLDRKELKSMSDNSISNAEKFSWNHVAQSYLDLYKKTYIQNF